MERLNYPTVSFLGKDINFRFIECNTSGFCPGHQEDSKGVPPLRKIGVNIPIADANEKYKICFVVLSIFNRVFQSVFEDFN